MAVQDIKRGTILTDLSRVRVRLDDIQGPTDLKARGWSDQPVITGEDGAFHLYMHTGRFVNVSRRRLGGDQYRKAEYLSIQVYQTSPSSTKQ